MNIFEKRKDLKTSPEYHEDKADMHERHVNIGNEDRRHVPDHVTQGELRKHQSVSDAHQDAADAHRKAAQSQKSGHKDKLKHSLAAKKASDHAFRHHMKMHNAGVGCHHPESV